MPTSRKQEMLNSLHSSWGECNASEWKFWQLAHWRRSHLHDSMGRDSTNMSSIWPLSRMWLSYSVLIGNCFPPGFTVYKLLLLIGTFITSLKRRMHRYQKSASKSPFCSLGAGPLTQDTGGPGSWSSWEDSDLLSHTADFSMYQAKGRPGVGPNHFWTSSTLHKGITKSLGHRRRRSRMTSVF